MEGAGGYEQLEAMEVEVRLIEAMLAATLVVGSEYCMLGVVI